MMIRMTDRVQRFNSLLALLRLPVQLPLLRLATPTLLLTVLEAILETRIVDVPAQWRADPDPATRLKVVQYLLRAIHQVTLGITTRTGLVPPSDAKQLEPRKIVDQDEQSLETVLEVLLWIADALDIKSRPPPPSSQRPRTVRVQNSSPPPLGNLKACSGVDTGEGKLFSRWSPMQQSPRRLGTTLSDTSSPSKQGLATTHRRLPSAAASEPGPLTLERSASPHPPLRSGPPPTTPARRDRLSTATTTNFLAELARASASSSSHTSIEGDTIGARSPPPTSPRKSIVEVMRSLELRRTEKTAGGTAAVDRRRKLSPPPVEHQGAVLLQPVESAHHSSAGSGTRLRPKLAPASPPLSAPSSSSSAMSPSSVRSSSPPSKRKTARRRSRSKVADERPPNSGSRIDPLPPCTCTCTVVEETSAAAHSARPARHPRKQSPSFPSASPVYPLPSTSAAPSRDLQGGSRSLPSSSPSSPAQSTPTSQRAAPPKRIRVSRISPTALQTTAANDTPNPLESGLLSIHSSTDLDLDSPLSSRPPAPSAAPFTSPPPTGQATTSYGTGSITDTPSPYTLLLLAHRDRLREKLKILERRERDRKAATEAAAVGPRGQGLVHPGQEAGITPSVVV